jgi:hypothetical protein
LVIQTTDVLVKFLNDFWIFWRKNEKFNGRSRKEIAACHRGSVQFSLVSTQITITMKIVGLKITQCYVDLNPQETTRLDIWVEKRPHLRGNLNPQTQII